MKIKYLGHDKFFYWNKGLTIGKIYETNKDNIFKDDEGKRVMLVNEIKIYFQEEN